LASETINSDIICFVVVIILQEP